jgi:hypothetical protein
MLAAEVCAITYDNWKDSAVEQKVGDEEDHQANGNGEYWWNILLLRILLEQQTWRRVRNSVNAKRHVHNV